MLAMRPGPGIGPKADETYVRFKCLLRGISRRVNRDTRVSAPCLLVTAAVKFEREGVTLTASGSHLMARGPFVRILGGRSTGFDPRTAKSLHSQSLGALHTRQAIFAYVRNGFLALTVAEILTQFDADLAKYGVAENAIYFALQRRVQDAKVNSTQQLALSEAGRIAEALGSRLAPFDAIRAEDEAYWVECAFRLREVVALARSTLSATEMAFHLQAHRDFFREIKSPI